MEVEGDSGGSSGVEDAVVVWGHSGVHRGGCTIKIVCGEIHWRAVRWVLCYCSGGG